MGLPIGTALFGLGIALGARRRSLSNVISMPDFTTAMVAMIGLGVGIDYALFIVTRYREGFTLGLDVEDAVVESIDTSGRAVLFAGITVIISLLGLIAHRASASSTGVAIASAIGVLMMILGSLTLLPALLGWVGTRIDNTTRAALIAVGIAVVGAFVGVVTGQSADLPRRLRRWRSCSSPSASPSSRCASSSRTAPSGPRSSASGTAGAGSSSTARGRACSAPPACS